MKAVIARYEEVNYSLEEIKEAARRFHDQLDNMSGYQTLLIVDVGGGAILSITLFDESVVNSGELVATASQQSSLRLFDYICYEEQRGPLIFQRGL